MRHPWRRALVALALLGSAAAGLGAQDVSALVPGTRVRLPPPTSIEGTVLSLTATTLTIRDDAGRSVEMVRLNDMRLFAHAGPGPCSGARRGWCVVGGAVAGGAVGALAFLVVTTNEHTDALNPGVVYLGAPLGALFGAALGAIVGGDRWHRITLPSAVVSPTARRAGLQARFTF